MTGIRGQRTRWEHGHLGLILAEAPGLLLFGLRNLNVGTVALALDLMVPPLALFVILATVNVVLDGVFAILSAGLYPSRWRPPAWRWPDFLSCCRGCGGADESFHFMIWRRRPVYALRKIPIYIGFLLSRQLDWVRSKRDP